MQKETLEKYQIIANIFAVIAIPVLVGVFGWVIQNHRNQKEIRRDFVQIAISVLSDKTKSENGDVNLKGWAVRLLANSSPVEFTPEEMDALRNSAERNLSLRRLTYLQELEQMTEIMNQFRQLKDRKKSGSVDKAEE